MRGTGVAAGLVLILAPGHGFAHHSIAALYDRARAVSVKGRLVSVELVNPHSKIEIEVSGPGGRVVTWKVETAGVMRMRSLGLQADTLRIGDPITAVGYPSHSGDRTAWLTRLETPDRVYDFSQRGTPAPRPIPAN